MVAIRNVYLVQVSVCDANQTLDISSPSSHSPDTVNRQQLLDTWVIVSILTLGIHLCTTRAECSETSTYGCVKQREVPAERKGEGSVRLDCCTYAISHIAIYIGLFLSAISLSRRRLSAKPER